MSELRLSPAFLAARRKLRMVFFGMAALFAAAAIVCLNSGDTVMGIALCCFVVIELGLATFLTQFLLHTVPSGTTKSPET